MGADTREVLATLYVSALTVQNRLDDLLQLMRAHLDSQPVIPVTPPVTPPPAPPADTTHDSGTATTLSWLAQGNPLPNPGGPPPANVGNYLDLPDFDINTLNAPRRFTNALSSHFITPDRDCTLILHVGKMPGNVADKVTLYVWGGGASESLEIPTTDQVIQVKFTAKAGVRYGISISANESFVLEVRAELD